MSEEYYYIFGADWYNVGDESSRHTCEEFKTRWYSVDQHRDFASLLLAVLEGVAKKKEVGATETDISLECCGTSYARFIIANGIYSKMTTLLRDVFTRSLKDFHSLEVGRSIDQVMTDLDDDDIGW